MTNSSYNFSSSMIGGLGRGGSGNGGIVSAGRPDQEIYIQPGGGSGPTWTGRPALNQHEMIRGKDLQRYMNGQLTEDDYANWRKKWGVISSPPEAKLPSPAPAINKPSLGNPSPAHSMNPNAVGPQALGGMAPKAGGVPSGMRGLPTSITPDMLQNPEFLSMLQQMLQQQQASGFSKSIFGR